MLQRIYPFININNIHSCCCWRKKNKTNQCKNNNLFIRAVFIHVWNQVNYQNLYWYEYTPISIYYNLTMAKHESKNNPNIKLSNLKHSILCT